MKNKKIGRAVFWLSAFFILEQCIFSGQSHYFQREKYMLFDKMKSAGENFASLTVTELFPYTVYANDLTGTLSFLKSTGENLSKEFILSVDFCKDYWEDEEQLMTGSDQVPSYFLEADEEKEETVRDITEETKKTIIPEGSVSYTKKQLADYQFLLKTFYIVDSTTTVTSKELQGDKLASKDLSISMTGENPKILIYHTHGSEDFVDSKSGKKRDTVIGVGDELTSILENTYHIKVYHDRSVYDTINGVLDRSKAYT
ncbi:MAG: stage II sporulation protein P, partial [Lachnospiraceae bacterium]|nr:stage II sporulation protein P [Lachnospiraceae bacterium]